MRATVRLPTCSGVNVSGEGLVLTNQHCIVACLNQLSTPEQNYFVAGFTAHAREQEAQCPGLAVQVLDGITDVTSRIEAAAEGAQGVAFARVRDAEIARIQSECSSAALRCEVMTLYEGGRYALYRYRRYDDVRLVFAPDYAMAQFGGETENFQFPRTCLDFALLRLYQNGVPARTPTHVSLRTTPPQQDEIVLVSGNPGFTSRLKSVPEIAFERDVFAPWREAALLSHGTAEQVYLLLRVALADHLTRSEEVCPLILDDPTPHFDAERTLAVLDLLLQLADTRQIVLFSQEDAVLQWAERRLDGGCHRLVRLPGPSAHA